MVWCSVSLIAGEHRVDVVPVESSAVKTRHNSAFVRLISFGETFLTLGNTCQVPAAGAPYINERDGSFKIVDIRVATILPYRFCIAGKKFRYFATGADGTHFLCTVQWQLVDETSQKRHVGFIVV